MDEPITYVAFFRWPRLTREERKLERITRRGEQGLMVHPWTAGVDVEVRLCVYEQDSTLFIGGVDVRTAPQDIVTPYGTIAAPRRDARRMTTDLLRMIPLGALEQEALEWVTSDESYSELRDHTADDPESFERLRNAVERSRRGRPSKLTPRLLEVTAAAYAAGGRQGVQAVQRALDEAGHQGSGPNGETTWDQAAKAVARARKVGLLPPARRSETKE